MNTDPPPTGTARRSRWQLGDSPEFERFANFTDAVFAIAMTLLVLGVRIEPLTGDTSAPSEMWSRLGDLAPQLVAFAVAFILLGFYWIAHHRFVDRLEAFDRRLMAINLVYLAFVALLPFPTTLVGEYEENPVSVIVFAVVLTIISGLETVMLAYSHRVGLMRQHLTADAYRMELLASLQPVVMFLVTLPLAFVSPTVTLLSWAVLSRLLGWLLDRTALARRVATTSPDGR